MQQRTARVERPLTYAIPPDAAVGIGTVVRVPLGPRELFGYAISEPREGTAAAGTRAITAWEAGAPAFDADTLALARWMAERYCCSLGEALGAVVFAAAIPRTADRFEITGSLDPAAHATVSPRLLRLIREDFAGGFAPEALLRHPEARRAGDRRTLLAALATLQRAGALRRVRTHIAPRVAESRERVLTATGRPVRGPRVRALAALVETQGSLRRSDALLAGFSHAIVARAIREGALAEASVAARAQRANASSDDVALVATDEQRDALARVRAAIDDDDFREILTQGVTGSGKTFVYLRAIEHAVARGGRAIVLVPEISLTPQTARRFERAFGDRVAVLHSALSDRERFENWAAAGRGDVDVVVGARSALFAPLPGVSLVVVDEAHERTYKQDAVPRYDAIDVAREKMRRVRGTLVLGSATPPLEAYARAGSGAIAHVRLDRRATGWPLPAVTIVDLAAEFERANRRIFSTQLVDALGARIACGEKTVLFVNRRGSAGFMLCRACGAVPECARCSTSFVAHRSEGLLRCHFCDAQRPLPERCPACGGGPIREFGVGTQKVAETVTALFPSARVVRMDSDTTTRVGDHARLLDAFETRGDVLVGTQMVAKGLDFDGVTLAGVVAADIGLHVPDFRAAERTFGLITQVAGRSGRARPGEAIVQTYSPAHPAIAFAARHDYDGFASRELATRRELGWPPFSELVYLGVIGATERHVIAAAARYADLLRHLPATDVLGPAPYPVARVNDEWRYRIVVKARDAGPVRREIRETLVPLARGDRFTRLAVHVDP